MNQTNIYTITKFVYYITISKTFILYIYMIKNIDILNINQDINSSNSESSEATTEELLEEEIHLLQEQGNLEDSDYYSDSDEFKMATLNSPLPALRLIEDSDSAYKARNAIINAIVQNEIQTKLGKELYQNLNGIVIDDAAWDILVQLQFPDYLDPNLQDRQRFDRQKIHSKNLNMYNEIQKAALALLPEYAQLELLNTIPPKQLKLATNILMPSILNYIKERFIQNVLLTDKLEDTYAAKPFPLLSSQVNAQKEIAEQRIEISLIQEVNENVNDEAKNMKLTHLFKAKLLLTDQRLRDKINEFRAGLNTYRAYHDAIFAAYEWLRHQSITPQEATTATANAAYGRQRKREVTAKDIGEFLRENKDFMYKCGLRLVRDFKDKTKTSVYCPCHGYCNHTAIDCIILKEIYPKSTIELMEKTLLPKMQPRGRQQYRSRSNSRSRSPKRSPPRGRSKSPDNNVAKLLIEDESAFSMDELIAELDRNDVALEAYADEDDEDIAFLSVNNKRSFYTAKIDSGATKTFTPYTHNVLNSTNAMPLTVRTAGNEKFISNTAGTLTVKLPNVNAHVVPGLQDTLISVSDYCTKNDATFIFDKDNCRVTQKYIPLEKSEILLQAPLDNRTGLYITPLGVEPVTNTEHANALYFHNGINHQNNYELVKFYYTMFGCPPASTFLQAIIQFDDLKCFPGLTVDKIRKNMPHTPITATGHFKRVRQGLGSTKIPENLPPTNKRVYVTTISIKDDNSLHDLFSSLKKHNKTLYSDLMGRFPITSYDGYDYICVFYHPASNYIHLEPMKNRSSTEYKATFEKGLEFYESKMQIISKFIIDNESSREIEKFFESKNLTYQYVPPKNHRSNQAERAIDTAKSHVISSLQSTDPTFDLKEWPKLLPQIEITLNWLRVSPLNAHMSAYGNMFGPYDYKKNPMVPLGTLVMFYEAKKDRTSAFGNKGIQGNYIGPSLKHYRCYRIYNRETKAIINTDTVIFYPQRYILPGNNSIEHLDKAITYLSDVLNEIHLLPNGQPDKSKISRNIIDQFYVLRNMLKSSMQSYPPNTIQPSIQNLPSIDDIMHPIPPENEQAIPRVNNDIPRMTDDIPRVTDTTPTVTDAIPRVRDTILSPEERTVPITDLKSRKENNTANTTNNSTTIKKRGRPKKLQVSFVPNDISSTRIIEEEPEPELPIPTNSLPNEQTPNAQPSPELDEIDENIPLAQLMEDEPFLKKLNLYYSPPPTVPLPFQITEETDTQPKLQRHLPASSTAYGYTVNTKVQTSMPLSEYTVRAKTPTKLKYSKEVKGSRRDKILDAHHSEYERLVDTTKTMTFTNTKPKAAIATYYNPILEEKIDQNNKEIIRVRGTGGGNNVVYEFGNTSQVADGIAFKILLNALASEDGHLITSDIKDFFLTATLPEKVYLKILWSQLPAKTIEKYNLKPNVDSKGNKFIYGELHQALYGLPQANMLAAQKLKENLALHEFYETDIPCLYRHKTRNITILTHVDDFAIKLSKIKSQLIEDAIFMKTVMDASGYKGKFNWGGINFTNLTVPNEYKLTWCGYEIHHDKIKRVVTISMNDYYDKIAAQIPSNVQPCNTPGIPFNIKYGAKEQFVIETANDFKLTPDQLKFLQKFVGEILWYSNAVGHDILTAISKLSTHQSAPTKDTFPFTVERIQGYLKQYGYHKIQFQASNMKLHIMSDASFDSEPKSKSRGGSFMWIGNNEPNLINGPIYCQSKILPGVPQSAAVAEIVQHVESGKMGIYARRILRCLGYPQTPTIILADNLCSIDYAHNNTKGRTLKTIARRTNWLKHVVRKNVYIFRYISSKNNIADIFTKLLDKNQHNYLCNLFLIRENMLGYKKAEKIY